MKKNFQGKLRLTSIMCEFINWNNDDWPTHIHILHTVSLDLCISLNAASKFFVTPAGGSSSSSLLHDKNDTVIDFKEWCGCMYTRMNIVPYPWIWGKQTNQEVVWNPLNKHFIPSKKNHQFKPTAFGLLTYFWDWHASGKTWTNNNVRKRKYILMVKESYYSGIHHVSQGNQQLSLTTDVGHFWCVPSVVNMPFNRTLQKNTDLWSSLATSSLMTGWDS